MPFSSLTEIFAARKKKALAACPNCSSDLIPKGAEIRRALSRARKWLGARVKHRMLAAVNLRGCSLSFVFCLLFCFEVFSLPCS